MTSQLDLEYMELSMEEAKAAARSNEVPVGALLVRHGVILAKARNATINSKSALAHAELLALEAALAGTGDRYLAGATLYTTLEPCSMCAGALLLARVSRVVIAAVDPKSGAFGSLYNLAVDPRLNHSVEVCYGVLADEASGLLRSFFESRRNSGSLPLE